MALLCALSILAPQLAQAQGKLPGEISRKLVLVNGSLDKVEARLHAGSVDRKSLDLAQRTLEDVKRHSPKFAHHPAIQTVERRLEDVKAQVLAFESRKKEPAPDKDKPQQPGDEPRREPDREPDRP